MLDVKRTRTLLAEAREDLRKYDGLRANTVQMIETYEKRLELLGDEQGGNALPLPGVEQAMTTPTPKTYKGALVQVLEASPKPLNARQIWEGARDLGVSTSSTNPLRLTDTMLRDLVKKGRIVKTGRGLYSLTKETQAAT
jgi:hypothetical protein